MSYPKAIRAVLEEMGLFVLGRRIISEDQEVNLSLIDIEPGEYYGSAHKTTTSIRLLLTGQYSKTEITRPLQPSEYVAFELAEQSIILPEKAKHWLPGDWYKHLKGSSGVHSSVVPSAGAVMEFVDKNQLGKIGLVTTVDEDQEITFSSIGLYNEGEFEVHTLPASVWRELRPIFIQFKANT